MVDWPVRMDFFNLKRGFLQVLAVFFLSTVISGSASGRTFPTRNSHRPEAIKSQSQLLKLLRGHQPRYYAGFRTGLTSLVSASVVPTAQTGDVTASSTLLQVAGVDEGDIVKNDSGYIYQINQGRVLIIHAFPDSSLGLVQTVDFSDGSFYPQELYLDAQHLVVVGSAFDAPAIPFARPFWYFSTSTVKAIIYDIVDPASPSKVREVEFEGDWIASRKIGSNLFLIGRQYPNFYPLLASSRSIAKGNTLPKFRDTATGGKFKTLGLASCFYFPGFDDPIYLLIAGIDLSDPNSPLDLNAYLGAGNQVYASTQSLYVTGSRPGDIFFAPQLSLGAGSAVTGVPVGAPGANLIGAGTVLPTPAFIVLPFDEQTDIFKFSLNNAHADFVAAATVPGSILNQYSMDESNAYFRVATTQHGWWSATGQDNNNIFVFDDGMSLVGSLTNVASGEQIYSARFLGNRAFLVTFEQIDPLFAVDLSDPTNPTIVGQLTLPGYSNFLLPYDENHLIGFGKDVIVAQGQTDGDVPWWNGLAFYQGMKLALFDVTDLHNPVLLHSASIGDRGTNSAALYDPHAILFDRTTNTLAFPIDIAELQNPDPNQPWLWGDTLFQGVQVYDVSIDNGFVLRGEVTQIPSGDDIWEDWDRHIDRVLFIGPDLYTLSNAELKVSDFATLTDKATLELPSLPDEEVARPTAATK